MSDTDELATKGRRRRLIERLNEKEKLIGPQSPAQSCSDAWLRYIEVGLL